MGTITLGSHGSHLLGFFGFLSHQDANPATETPFRHTGSFFSTQPTYHVSSMTKAFNDWTLRQLLQDPALLNATICMAAAETEIRHGGIPDGISSSLAVTKSLSRSARITDYTYFKLEAIKYLNRTLCSSDNSKLNPASICAIMFLAFAEVCCLSSSSQRSVHTDSVLLTVLPRQLSRNSYTLSRTKSYRIGRWIQRNPFASRAYHYHVSALQPSTNAVSDVSQSGLCMLYHGRHTASFPTANT
jgi:hypothetical protein